MEKSLVAPELEQAVLGGILGSADNWHLYSSVISTGDVFHQPKHRDIWNLCREAFDKGIKIDMFTIDALRKERGIDSFNVAYLSELQMRVTGDTHTRAHAAILRDKWMGRKAIEMMAITQKELFSGKNAEDSIARMWEKFSRLSSDESTGAQKASKVMEELMESAKKASEKDDNSITGERFFGIESVDKLFDGREPGDLIMIGAGAKQGKSSTETNILAYSIDNKVPTYAASAEMQNKRLLARSIAMMTGGQTRSLERGEQFSDEELFEKIKVISARIAEAPLWMSDGNLDLRKAISNIYHYHREHKVELFLFDRVGLFDEVSLAKSGAEHGARSAVTASLRKVANELGITIILYSQLTKEYLNEPGARPAGHHIFGGIGGPANCTKAALVYRPEAITGANYNEFPESSPFYGQLTAGVAEIFTVYNNNGPLGSVKVGFNAHSQSYFETNGGTLAASDPDDFESTSAIEMKSVLIDPTHKTTAEGDLPF